VDYYTGAWDGTLALAASSFRFSGGGILAQTVLGIPVDESPYQFGQPEGGSFLYHVGFWMPEAVSAVATGGGALAKVGSRLASRFAPKAGRAAAKNVIVDTNAVYNKPGVLGALNSGEVPVVTGTTRAEIANLAAAGRMKPPGFAGELGTVPDIMDVNLRINIRAQLAALKPGQPGLFGDGAIGATAIRSGSSVITSDKTFATVLRSYGVNVRKP
jgi:hypothetical protein